MSPSLTTPLANSYMIKIKTQWNSGNFSLSHQVEATEEQVLALAEKGLLWYMQRNREHDEVLGAFEKQGDKQVRRKGFKRGDVAFAVPMAMALKAAYGDIVVGEAGKLAVDTMVGEYLRETGADSKFTEERAIAGRHESKGDLEEWLMEKCEFAEATHGEDGEYSVEMLRAVRAYKLQVLRASAAEL